MARYTIELRNVIRIFGENIVKSWFMDYDLSDYLTDEEIAVITARGTWSKEKLAQLMLDHYYMYEIGFETPALFRHYVKIFMKEIMEEKAPLIYSAAIEYDPLVNVDYSEVYTGATSGGSNSTSTSTGSGLTVNSDTPQGQITKANILAGNYASSTGANETSNSVTDASTNTGSQNYTKSVKGNSGVSATAQKMIQQYRENIIMINRDIVKAASSLFMTIY
ncbi:MAG: hypothetical protein J6S67_06660 [Methanobrevibacter sp.]|nr:hypothetical protein [Methanobrevibacter sp.]